MTCPIMRIHPAVVAPAAATSAVLHDGRFVLGVGAGEALSEHITGERWPFAEERLEMLEEAVGVMRSLWEDGFVTHRGRYFTVDQAQVYTRPATAPKVQGGFKGCWAPTEEEGVRTAEHAEQLQASEKAGFDEVYVANMGPHYREMTEMYRREFL